jgi:hypothetical protein
LLLRRERTIKFKVLQYIEIQVSDTFMLDLTAVSNGIITLLQELGTENGNRKGPDNVIELVGFAW